MDRTKRVMISILLLLLVPVVRFGTIILGISNELNVAATLLSAIAGFLGIAWVNMPERIPTGENREYNRNN